MARELWAFLVHFRWHYQVFILSGGYLLGGMLQPEIEPVRFWLQFVNVHVLLNGSVTAFNSYFDEDEGPIGGLQSPPPLARWTLPASVLVQVASLAWAWTVGPLYAALFAITIVLSTLYSATPFRWKGHPWLSFVAVGIGTGTNTFWMGYLAAGAVPMNAAVWLAGVGVALLLLSLYPVSQVYQVEEDSRRGDRTFAAEYGLKGVLRLYHAAYPLGLCLASYGLATVRPWLAGLLLVGGGLGGLATHTVLRRLEGRIEEYGSVMRIKYGASLSFVGLLVGWWVWMAIADGATTMTGP